MLRGAAQRQTDTSPARQCGCSLSGLWLSPALSPDRVVVRPPIGISIIITRLLVWLVIYEIKSINVIILRLLAKKIYVRLVFRSLDIAHPQ